MTVQFSEERKAPLEAREDANAGYASGDAKPARRAPTGEFKRFAKGAGAILAFSAFVLYRAIYDPQPSFRSATAPIAGDDVYQPPSANVAGNSTLADPTPIKRRVTFKSWPESTPIRGTISVARASSRLRKPVIS
jgi:hypothetical protein